MRVERSGVNEVTPILHDSTISRCFFHLKPPWSEPDLLCGSPISLCHAGALTTCVPLGLSISFREIDVPAP